jgi:hypothetical protein
MGFWTIFWTCELGPTLFTFMADSPWGSGVTEGFLVRQLKRG